MFRRVVPPSFFYCFCVFAKKISTDIHLQNHYILCFMQTNGTRYAFLKNLLKIFEKRVDESG